MQRLRVDPERSRLGHILGALKPAYHIARTMWGEWEFAKGIIRDPA